MEIELRSITGSTDLRSVDSLAADHAGDGSRDLLARLLAVARKRAADSEAIRDLAGALRLHAAAEPGFAAAMTEWLAGAGDHDHPLSRCLAAVLTEMTDGERRGQARRQGYRYGDRRDPLSRNYDRLR